MTKSPFHDQLSLEERATTLGREAMDKGLIPSFAVHYFPDAWVFYIPGPGPADPLTPEEAYLQLKRLLEKSG